MFLRSQHFDNQANSTTRREILAAITAQVSTHDFLVGCALGIHIGAAKVITSQFRNDKCERPVRQGDFFIPLKESAVLFLDLFKEWLDALTNSLLAYRFKGFEGADIEATSFIRLLLVIHFAENEVEELPEGGVFRHTFIAVYVVVAPPKSDAQHFRVSAAQAPHGAAFNAEGVISHGPVTDWIKPSVESGDLLLEEEEFKAVGPEAIVTAFGFGHYGF